jgi:hypothetical protein
MPNDDQTESPFEREVRYLCEDSEGLIPESWCCIDCGMDTAPGLLNRAEMEKAVEALGEKWYNGASVPQTHDRTTEVYCVRPAVWKAAGMADFGGCLCIRCLEKRLRRQLRPKDFLREHAFNSLQMPGTPLRAARLSAGKRRAP